MEGTQQAGAGWSRIADWVMGIYAWILTLAFGATLVDGIYARALSDNASVAAVTRAFNEAADFQQLPLAVGVMTGIAALVMASDKPLVRYLVIASLALTLAPLPIMLLLGDLMADAGAGHGLRLALAASASLFAMAATVVFLGRARLPGPE
jgi:hypothetical protein